MSSLIGQLEQSNLDQNHLHRLAHYLESVCDESYDVTKKIIIVLPTMLFVQTCLELNEMFCN